MREQHAVLILREGEGVRNLASRVLGLNLRRLSGDWQRRWGHPLELAETFVDPRLYRGTCYRAANWIRLGLSKGYARSNGRYTRRHGQRKVMLVYPLRAGARQRLADPRDRPEWGCKAVDVRYGQEALRSLREHLAEVEDSRGRHGRRHELGAVLALLVLARLAGKAGGRAAEAYAKTLSERELRALLEEVDLRGRTVTVDAGHASLETERAIAGQHGGDVLLRIKGNCTLTHATLSGLDWAKGAERSWRQPSWERSHRSSWERRGIEVFTPHGELFPFAHARQAYRITHESCRRLGGPLKRRHSYGITSLDERAATPQQLLMLQRRHWQVESANHYRRDTTFGEDRSRIRTGHGPANAAALNNLALALLLWKRKPNTTVPEAQIHYAGNRGEMLQMLLESG